MRKNTTNTNKASSSKITGHSKVNKANLLERIESLRDGNLIDDVFNSLEVFKLSEIDFDDLYKVLGQEDAAYLWNLLVQHNVWQETEEYPLLANVKEFSWYGDNLTANEGATEYLQSLVTKEVA
jgi:succinate dehydrogenase flavin-adding protein (antitoxin of CptAB toxin-antitoxin module)